MKKIYLLLGAILFNLEFSSLEPATNIDFNESIITAPNAGLILLYKGQYRPSNHVIYNTAMFPMTASTCYLLPIKAARKIPTCNNFTLNIRNKRFLADIISIGVSSAALGTATASMVLTKTLAKKVNQLETSMQTMSNRLEIGEARMVQFDKNQIRLGMILQQSERVLNSTVNQVNQHSQTLEIHDKRLNDHQQRLVNLQQHVMDNEQATVNRFLNLAIHDIINDKPTLAFLDPSEIYFVVKSILQENNITISENAEQIPIVELITKLILRQQIDFIPAERYSNIPGIEIGKLTFTTFYAMPNEEISDFNIYQVITGPFVHHNKVVRLAQMPTYIGINAKGKSSISWTNDDISSCIFHLITTCRETPAEKTSQYGNACLEQILSGNKLRSCRTEQTKINLPHIQQLQNGRWLISMNNTSLHCIRTPTQYTRTSSTSIWNENSEVIIPPVAIVTVPNGTTIHCPEFNLPGPITPDTRSIINIIKNLSTIEEDNEVIDMHKELTSNVTWDKLPYLNGDIDELLQEMLETTQTSKANNVISWHNQHSSKFIIGLSIIIAALIVIIVFLIWYAKRSINGKITIALPTMSAK
jgi:hypothetical protein